MDIRIGNDVCVQIPVSEFGNIDVDNIKKMKCTFIKTQGDSCDCNSHPVFHHSSQYTVRGCGYPSYYTYPCNTPGYHMGGNPHCGFTVCDDHKPSCSFQSHCKLVGNTINAYFPAEFQKCLGTYKCVFEIKVEEDNWDYDNLHTYSISYENIFTLKRTGSQTGSIVIRPTSTEKYDTYIITLTESELKKYSEDYAVLILKSDGFKLVSLPNGSREVSIAGNKKRIVVISSYDSLLLTYNSYIFPTSMYRLNNSDYFMYVSDYTYSNIDIELLLIDTGQSNAVTPGLPVFDSESDEPTDDPTEDPSDEPTDEPGGDEEYEDVSKLYGYRLDIVNGSFANNVLSLSGKVTNYTMIV